MTSLSYYLHEISEEVLDVKEKKYIDIYSEQDKKFSNSFKSTTNSESESVIDTYADSRTGHINYTAFKDSFGESFNNEEVGFLEIFHVVM